MFVLTVHEFPAPFSTPSLNTRSVCGLCVLPRWLDLKDLAVPSLDAISSCAAGSQLVPISFAGRQPTV
jgi:hypothetical protein